MRFEALLNSTTTPEKIKDVELEETDKLSAESLRFRNIERNLKISDMDGISDFSESPDGAFISYTTANKNELKVFNRKIGTVQTLYTASNEKGDEMINIGDDLKTYRFGNKFAVGYTRKGEFVIQELSHGNQAGEIILTMEQPHVFGTNCLLSKDGKNLVTQDSADEINFNDLGSGETEKVDLDFHSSKMVDNENGSFGMVINQNQLHIFDKDSGTLFSKLKTKDPFMSASFIDDDNHFVLSQNENLVFYELKNNDYQKVKELNIGFRSDKIIEAADKKHLFCHSWNFGGFFVVEKETGKIVSKIESENIQQNWKGEIVILNKDGSIEQYNLRDAPSTGKDKTQKIMIAGETPVYDKDEYSQFLDIKSETIKGLFWDVYSNLISTKLEKEGKFEWGKQRLYIEIPMNEFEKVKDIVIDISSKENIPIQFKFIDQEKTDLEIAKDKTRFVLNFKDIADTKKFYHSLSQNEIYKKIIPDREQDYNGYKLDDKTFYASGFAEYRKEDLQNLEEFKKDFIENPDGTYTAKTPDTETGKLRVLSAEEYENLINQKDPTVISKENWEKQSE